MRASIAWVVVGEMLSLAAVGCWSIPWALLAAGVQCLAVGLLRQTREREPVRQPLHRRAAGPRGRVAAPRWLRRRPSLRLVRKAAS